MRCMLLCLVLLGAAASAGAQEAPAQDREFQRRLRMSRHATADDAAWADARRVDVERSLSADSDSLLLLTPLANAGRAHEILGHWGPAIENYDRARAIAERHLPADALRLAWPLRDLANLLRIVNVAPYSQEYFERSLAIQEEHLGPTDEEIAETLRQRVRLWLNLGDFERAEADAERALSVAEERDDGGTLLPACMQARARVHDELGQFEQAFRLYEDASRLLRARVAGDHVGLADLLNDFSRHLQLLGDLPHARRLLTESADILLSKFPPEHVYNIVVQANLSELMSKEGDFAGALRLLTAQTEAMRQTFGPRHPRVAELLNARAGNQLLLGDAEAAVALYREVLAIYAEAYGEEHITMGQTRSNLAAAYQELERYEEAEAELRRATELIEKSAGPDSFLHVHSLSNLGELQLEAGENEAALRSLAVAADAARRVLGPAHQLLAENLLNLARAELIDGNGQLAIEHAEEALDIATSQSEANPLRAEAALLLAELRLEEDADAAFDFALLAEEVGREHLRLLSRGASQSDALRYAARRARGLPLLMEILRRAPTPERSERAWDALLRSRAIVFDELAERALAGRRSDDPSVEEKKSALRSSRARLARLISDPSERLEEDERRALVDEATTRLKLAEEELAAVSNRYRARSEVQAAGADELGAQLPAESALLSFYRYAWKARERYVCFVRKGPELRFVDLGDAEGIDAAVRAWRDEATSGAVPPGVLEQAQWERYVRAATALRVVLWDPLELGEVGGRIFFVADGVLHQLNPGALLAEDGGLLLESAPPIHHLSAERDLLARYEGGGQGLLAVGGAAFGDTRPAAGEHSTCTGIADLFFRRLPSSRSEVEALASLAPGRTLVGAEATEQEFAASAGAFEMLHLATHGFFLSTACRTGESPLLRSGLVFAGANDRGTREQTDDGILTGEEILSLELDPVEWVVLSACDTGLGDDVEGAGLLGLRRAFRWSGANTLISSLWTVEDEATAALMRELYRQRLQEKASSTRALRRAQLALIERRRAQGASVHPYTWAAFVASGDWR